jgi:hypothetical protein
MRESWGEMDRSNPTTSLQNLLIMQSIVMDKNVLFKNQSLGQWLLAHWESNARK